MLGVGAGYEATIYWLTRKVGKVVATDLYSADDAWSETDSSAEMLIDPGKFWEGDWEPERLEVRDMNALELDFADDSFDGVFSSSSIEHFGGFGEIRRSIEEIYRVLRPGGVAALATEFKLEGDGHGWPGVYLFDEAALRAAIFDGLWWDPATPLETTVSDATRRAPVELQEAVKEPRASIQVWSQYPHLVPARGPLPVHKRPRRDGEVELTHRGLEATRTGISSTTKAARQREAGGDEGAPGPAESLVPRSASLHESVRMLQAEAASCSRSASTIISITSSQETFGSQPSTRRAFEASATTSSISAGLASSGSMRMWSSGFSPTA